jgi:hypothetical protein
MGVLAHRAENLSLAGVSHFRLARVRLRGNLEDHFFCIGGDRIMTHDFRIAKVQRTLRWFEDDIPLLNMRVKELSKERQESARRFAAAVIDQTRAELERLVREQPHDAYDSVGAPSEPAD